MLRRCLRKLHRRFRSTSGVSWTYSCLPLANPQVSFCGPISAIPVPTGENKIFSIDIHAYLKKEAGQNVFSDFRNPPLGKHIRPRLGRWTTVSGEVVGEYKVNNCESLCVIVDDFAPAPAAKDDDTPMPPTGSSNTQTISNLKGASSDSDRPPALH